MELSFILKKLRKDNNFTQTELAKKIHYTPSTISDWENRRSEPSIFQLKLLADFFNCSIDYLVGREDELGNITVDGEALSESEQKLLNAFRSMPEARQRTVLDMVQALSEGGNASASKKSHA